MAHTTPDTSSFTNVKQRGRMTALDMLTTFLLIELRMLAAAK